MEAKEKLTDGITLNVLVNKKTHEEMMKVIGQQIISNPEKHYTKSEFVRDAIKHLISVKKTEIEQER